MGWLTGKTTAHSCEPKKAHEDSSCSCGHGVIPMFIGNHRVSCINGYDLCPLCEQDVAIEAATKHVNIKKLMFGKDLSIELSAFISGISQYQDVTEDVTEDVELSIEEATTPYVQALIDKEFETAYNFLGPKCLEGANPLTDTPGKIRATPDFATFVNLCELGVIFDIL